MGYESRFYIVNKTPLSFPNNLENEGYKYYGELISTFNLCCSDIHNEIKNYDYTDCYFYNDSSEQIFIDKYGECLREIPINDLIDILIKLMRKDVYRRYKPLLMLLMGFDLNQWDNLVVLHYGY